MTTPSPDLDPLAEEILATLREPVAVLDAALCVVAASPTFAMELGLSPGELVGQPLPSAGGGLWASRSASVLLHELAPRAELVEDHPVELGAGAGTRRVRVTVRPLRSGANRVERLLLTVRPDAGPASAPPEPEDPSLARLALRHATHVVALYRGDGSCVFVGEGCQSVLGYTAAEWMTLRGCDLIHQADLDAYGDALGVHGVADPPRRLLLRARHRSGEYAWMDTVLRAVEPEGSEPLLHVTARDVTQQRRSEEALRWLSRQTRLILDSAAEGIFGVDTRGIVTFVNPAAARALGFTAPELMGRHYSQFVEPGPAAAEDPVAGTLRDGVARAVVDAPFRRADGSSITVELSCNPARLDDAVVGAVVTFRDVSERRRAEEALRRAQWLTGVAQTALALRHEINNPLTTLLAEANLLELGGNTPEEEREMVATIAEQARRIRDAMQRLTQRQVNPTLRSDPLGSMLDLSGE